MSMDNSLDIGQAYVKEDTQKRKFTETIPFLVMTFIIRSSSDSLQVRIMHLSMLSRRGGEAGHRAGI